MWDSSEQSTSVSEDGFDSLAHFHDICKNTKIRISPFCEALYPAGWQELMDNFVVSISSMHCTIQKITLVYDYLEIVFTTRRLSDEARIWRAINECRKNTYIVCHVCGSSTMFRKSAGCHQFCIHCSKSAGTRGTTGTWLDKY